MQTTSSYWPTIKEGLEEETLLVWYVGQRPVFLSVSKSLTPLKGRGSLCIVAPSQVVSKWIKMYLFDWRVRRRLKRRPRISKIKTKSSTWASYLPFSVNWQNSGVLLKKTKQKMKWAVSTHFSKIELRCHGKHYGMYENALPAFLENLRSV